MYPTILTHKRDPLIVAVNSIRLDAFKCESTLEHVFNLLKHCVELTLEKLPFARYSIEWPSTKTLCTIGNTWDYWMLKELYETLHDILGDTGFSIAVILDLKVLRYGYRRTLLLRLDQFWRFANKR